MTLNKDRIDTLKYWLRKASIYLLKWILKIVIVVSIGALISYLIYRNTEFQQSFSYQVLKKLIMQ